MRIENLRFEHKSHQVRVAATISWEDCDRPQQDLYFATTQEFAHNLSCNPHAFLTAGIIPALQHGEKRIVMDAEICPELRDGLSNAMGWICHWYKLDRDAVQIEAKSKTTAPETERRARAGWFFSGGIDSLASLRYNRLHVPINHPNAFKEGLTIYGISSGGLEVETADEFLQVFDRLLNSMSQVAEDAGVTLIPVYTNIRQLDTDTYFWSDKFQGAALSAVAHTFSRRLDSVAIASSGDIKALSPHGSHPLLDPSYSSYDLRIIHHALTLSRLEKTKLVADWDVALQNLKVCTRVKEIKPDMLNCGKCDKCLRTMLALTALGKIEHAQTFPKFALSEEVLMKKVEIKTPCRLKSYQELVPLLRGRGRADLARAIERIADRQHGRSFTGKIDKLIRLCTGSPSRLEKLSAS